MLQTHSTLKNSNGPAAPVETERLKAKSEYPKALNTLLDRLHNYPAYSSLLMRGVRTKCFEPVLERPKNGEGADQTVVSERQMQQDAKMVEKYAKAEGGAFGPAWMREAVTERQFSRFFKSD